MLGAVAALCLAQPTAGQLAITEVHASQSITPALRGADYWELANFRTEPVSLTNCWFADDGGFTPAKNLAIIASTNWIGPGETIVFAAFRTDVLTTPTQFRQWWGENNFASDQRISVSQWGFGFSPVQDAVQIWQVRNGQPYLLDRVELAPTQPGESLTYDPVTGLLDRISVARVDGAFQAATTTDVGSPGVTTGPVPLRILDPPASTEVDGGSTAVLSVRAVGLPRPHFQWRFHDQPLFGETSRSLIIRNATADVAGQYSVEVSNGLTNLLSPSATLRVNLTQSCATIINSPTDAVVTPTHTAIFTVQVRGFPLPNLRWQFNGADIPGATNATLSVPNADLANIGLYTVHVANALCSTNASARLDVVPPASLIITEAMSSPSVNTTVSGHDDWWELTNVGDVAVNLRGYRFDDNSRSITNAVAVTNDVIVQPGCSVIWVSSMTPDAFRRWWGEENLPENLPIISYPGNGFDYFGDLIMLWNPSALVDTEWLLSRDFVNTLQGVSLWFDPLLAEYGELSLEGERGAFRAAESDDIGSPGWTSNEQRVVRPRILAVQHELSGVRVTWKTQPGRRYALQYRMNLPAEPWSTLSELAASGDRLSIVDPTTGQSQRFYRIVLLPETP